MSGTKFEDVTLDGKDFKAKSTTYGSLETGVDTFKAPLIEKPKEWWGARHTFTVMGFMGLANLYAMRVNLSVAIVAMTNTGNTGNDSQIGQECPFSTDQTNETTIKEAEFTWNAQEQGVILGAFFYGYIVTQIPGGFFAEKLGGKWFLGLGSLVTAIFTLLTPLAANWGTGYLIAVRIIEGLGEGVTYPAMQVLISKWLPTPERTRLGAFIWGGSQFGTVIALLLSGALAEGLGWEWVFYFFGILGCAWCIAWLLICHDSPVKHPRISQEERQYIEFHLPPRNEGTKLPFPPLWAMMTTPAFLALIAVHFGNNWGLYTLLTEIPTYLNNIQHFSLTTNGFLSALPYLLMWLFSAPCGFVADYLITTGKMKTVNVRRMAQMVAHYGAGFALIAMANVGCNNTMAIVWLCIAVALCAATYSGFQVNFVELSPNYAGTLMGISNAFATICGFVAPMVAGLITNDNQTIHAWSIVFYLSAGVYFGLNTIFVIFASSTIQPWNTYWESPLEKKEEIIVEKIHKH